jgi:hypothetical protein
MKNVDLYFHFFYLYIKTQDTFSFTTPQKKIKK